MNGKKRVDGLGNAITFKQIIQLDERSQKKEYTQCSRLASVHNELVGIAVYGRCAHY